MTSTALRHTILSQSLPPAGYTEKYPHVAKLRLAGYSARADQLHSDWKDRVANESMPRPFTAQERATWATAMSTLLWPDADISVPQAPAEVLSELGRLRATGFFDRFEFRAHELLPEVHCVYGVLGQYRWLLAFWGCHGVPVPTVQSIEETARRLARRTVGKYNWRFSFLRRAMSLVPALLGGLLLLSAGSNLHPFGTFRPFEEGDVSFGLWSVSPSTLFLLEFIGVVVASIGLATYPRKSKWDVAKLAQAQEVLAEPSPLVP